MQKITVTFTIFVLLFVASTISAQGEITSSWWTTDSGTSQTQSTSSTYTLAAAIGQPDASISINDGSGRYSLTSGFLAADSEAEGVETATLALQRGWNFIALPLAPTTPLNAETVCTAINGQGGAAVEINRWQAGGWDSHLCGQPFNAFTVTLVEGYFIRSNVASTWTIEGQSVTAPLSVTFQVGWNSLGLPQTDTYTAETLCADLISQGVTTDVIVRWRAGGWDSHLCGLPFNDFPLEIGAGYFIKARSAGSVILAGPQ